MTIDEKPVVGTPWSFADLRMPSLEEHRLASAAWLQQIEPCLYENWPQALREMSFPTVCVELTAEDQSELLNSFDGVSTSHRPLLAARIDMQIAANFNGGVFARLSSRSAKDACCDTLKCHSGADILNQFSSSERILDDLVQYKYLEGACYLLLREWMDIPKHEEWRCFVRDGRVVGISQYHYRDDFSELYGNDAGIHKRLASYLVETVIPVLPADPLVVDIWLRQDPMVIEINPYGLSDPCLFTYADLESEGGGFRIVSNNHDHREIAIG